MRASFHSHLVELTLIQLFPLRLPRRLRLQERQAAALRLLAHAAVLHLVQQAAGVPVGAKAVDRLALLQRRAAATYHAYPDEVRCGGGAGFWMLRLSVRPGVAPIAKKHRAGLCLNTSAGKGMTACCCGPVLAPYTKEFCTVLRMCLTSSHALCSLASTPCSAPNAGLPTPSSPGD